MSTHDLWTGLDAGLFLCWEKGREKAIQEPKMSTRAKDGELLELCWARGTTHYLAYWQGLRGEDLSIGEDVFDKECLKTKRYFAFGGDRPEREKRQIKLDTAFNKKKKEAAALQDGA